MYVRESGEVFPSGISLNHPPTIESPLPSVRLLHAPIGMTHQEYRDWFNTHQEILCSELGLTSPTILDHYSRQRGQLNPRHSSDPDHQWHSDRAHLTGAALPVATILYAERIEGDVAGISLLDTSVLLKHVTEKSGLSLTELGKVKVWLSRSKFYDTIISQLNDPVATARALENSHAATLERKAYERSFQFPAISRDLIQVNTLTREPCLYVDTLRTRRFEGLPLKVGQALHALVDDLLADPPSDAIYNHEWKSGDVLIFPHMGTVHEADPGNEGVRALQRILVA